jgi:membrane associated rhomboid family serine protease
VGTQVPAPDGARVLRLLKALVSFVVGTIAGALGNKVMGPVGAVFGFIAGGLAAWWVARRVFGE